MIGRDNNRGPLSPYLICQGSQDRTDIVSSLDRAGTTGAAITDPADGFGVFADALMIWTVRR